MSDLEIRNEAKELEIDHYWNKNIDKLKEEIAAKKAEIAPPENKPAPDGGIPEIQEEARTEARLKALEDSVIKLQSENRALKTENQRLESVMAKVPQKEIPERPNMNTFVYRKGEDGKIESKQVSIEEAEILYKEGYVDTPAKLKE